MNDDDDDERKKFIQESFGKHTEDTLRERERDSSAAICYILLDSPDTYIVPLHHNPHQRLPLYYYRIYQF